ncbi:hypothetical protein FI667_g15852, partial [Globisporangium splendens]
MGVKGHRKKGPRATAKAQAFAQSSIECIQTSKDKREQNRKRMRVVQLQRALDRKEKELKAFPKYPAPPKPPPRKGPTPPSEWKLKGAARPAALLARIAAGELDEHGDELKKPIETYNLYEATLKGGNFSTHAETREYLRIMKQLAEACCNAGMPDRGIKHYETCMQLDTDDSMRSREGLTCVLVDEGRGAEARELIDKFRGEASAVLAYCQVILEYVSWEVLEEEGSSEEVVREAFLKAFKLNPFIAVFIAAHETFFQVVEYVDDIKEPKPGSVEEAFLYCSQNIGVWLDTVGAFAWIEKELAELPEPVPTENDVSEEMYLGMYQTAVEMLKEELAEREWEEHESNSDDEVDGDEFDDYEPDDIDGGDD